jgi:hypothetical protein
MCCRLWPQLENALIVGDPDSPDISLKLCDFGYSKDELVGAGSVSNAPQRCPDRVAQRSLCGWLLQLAQGSSLLHCQAPLDRSHLTLEAKPAVDCIQALTMTSSGEQTLTCAERVAVQDAVRHAGIHSTGGPHR